MCWGCSPYCGNCYPAQKKTVVCPECGKVLTLTREECLMYLGLSHRMTEKEKQMHKERAGEQPLCKHCGKKLLEELKEVVEPMPCSRSRIICGYPCGRRVDNYATGDDRCKDMVPLAHYNPDKE